MNKSTFFTGQPILTQLLKFTDKRAIKKLGRSGGHDRYYKSFDTYTHLITMLYCTLNKCTSSREVISGMKACEHKLQHLGVKKSPDKSTLCDGNKKRSFDIFEKIYRQPYDRHSHFLPDSRTGVRSKLFIADASTITLFQEIMKAPSMGKANGRRKGGIKVHTLISAEDDVPIKINFTHARANEMTFLQKINLEKGSFIVFDKGYVDYSQYQRFSDEDVYFVTPQRKGSGYSEDSCNLINATSKQRGVLKDQNITLGTRTHAKKIKLKSRLVIYHDREKDRVFEFLTNNFELLPEQIANSSQLNQVLRFRWSN